MSKRCDALERSPASILKVVTHGRSYQESNFVVNMPNVETARATAQSPEPTSQNYFNYYTEIEDAFIRRRGKHLLLSPMDWALIETWKSMGVPLHVALGGIERAFDSHAANPRRRSVKSLLYCQEEVEARYAEWLDSQRGSAVDVVQTRDPATTIARDPRAGGVRDDAGLPFPREVIAAHLAQSRASLERARDARRERQAGDLFEALVRAASRLAEIEADFQKSARPNAEQLETSLTDLEQLLDRAIRAGIAPADLARESERAGDQLRPYRSRMERRVYEQTLDNLLVKQLREAFGVPPLSLFYL